MLDPFLAWSHSFNVTTSNVLVILQTLTEQRPENFLQAVSWGNCGAPSTFPSQASLIVSFCLIASI